MNKFTKVQKDSKKVEPVRYEDDFMKIINYEGWNIIDSPDCVICVIVLRDSNQVVFRQEYIPTYKKRDNAELYLHVISGTMDKEGESREDCLKREILEEAGIVIRENFPIVFEKSLYMTKGNMSQYHISIVELYKDDYYETVAKGDGSREEKLSKSVKIDFNDLNRLIPVDAITELMLCKVLRYLNM